MWNDMQIVKLRAIISVFNWNAFNLKINTPFSCVCVWQNRFMIWYRLHSPPCSLLSSEPFVPPELVLATLILIFRGLEGNTWMWPSYSGRVRLSVIVQIEITIGRYAAVWLIYATTIGCLEMRGPFRRNRYLSVCFFTAMNKNQAISNCWYENKNNI